MPLLRFVRSQIGRKVLMAVTGLGLFGFVVVHMLGNLQIFLGPDTLNAYAHLLKAKPELLWTFRVGLFTMAVLHVWAAVSLWRENKAARPVGYAEPRSLGATLASRTMMASGLVVLAFLIFHLLHFTVGAVDPSYLQLRDSQNRHDVYRMVILGFRNPWISGFYILGVGLLSLHLSHGFASLFRTLGLSHPGYRRITERGGVLFAWIIFLGMSVVPVAVLMGWVA